MCRDVSTSNNEQCLCDVKSLCKIPILRVWQWENWSLAYALRVSLINVCLFSNAVDGMSNCMRYLDFIVAKPSLFTLYAENLIIPDETVISV